jgi:hypothetical protein
MSTTKSARVVTRIETEGAQHLRVEAPGVLGVAGNRVAYASTRGGFRLAGRPGVWNSCSALTFPTGPHRLIKFVKINRPGQH